MNLNRARTRLTIPMRIESQSLLQLLRLSSPALPIGGYAYSQGLETACENGYVNSKESLCQWVTGVLENNMQYLDIPIFSRLYDSFSKNDDEKIQYWNQYLLASRETNELYLEDCQMGNALIRLLVDLRLQAAENWLKRPCALATAFCLACTYWNIEKFTAAHGMLWSWCENQISIGIKLIPLGQTNGQQVLSELIENIHGIIDTGMQLEDEQLGASCAGLIMSSMQHEDQYTRLFRS